MLMEYGVFISLSQFLGAYEHYESLYNVLHRMLLDCLDFGDRIIFIWKLSIFSQACGYHVLFVSYLITRNYDLKEIMIDVVIESYRKL